MKTVISSFLIATLMASVLIMVFTFPIMLLWNWLIPSLFNGPVLTFWQTLGLAFLIRLFLPTTSVRNKENK